MRRRSIWGVGLLGLSGCGLVGGSFEVDPLLGTTVTPDTGVTNDATTFDVTSPPIDTSTGDTSAGDTATLADATPTDAGVATDVGFDSPPPPNDAAPDGGGPLVVVQIAAGDTHSCLVTSAGE